MYVPVHGIDLQPWWSTRSSMEEKASGIMFRILRTASCAARARAKRADLASASWNIPTALNGFLRRRQLGGAPPDEPPVHTKCGVVPPTRIERATQSLGNSCSIQLSYGGSASTIPKESRNVYRDAGKGSPNIGKVGLRLRLRKPGEVPSSTLTLASTCSALFPVLLIPLAALFRDHALAL